MPKKFQGENSKAVIAKARKAEAQAVTDARKKKEQEDAAWTENDKHVLKKEARKVSPASPENSIYDFILDYAATVWLQFMYAYVFKL